MQEANAAQPADNLCGGFSYRRWRNDVGSAPAPKPQHFESHAMNAGDLFSVDEGDGFSPEVEFYVDQQS